MQVIILTAGKSSRFWPINKQHKSLCNIMGKSLIAHLLDSLKGHDVIIVQDKSKDIENALKGYKVKYVIQKDGVGMDVALESAKDLIKDRFLVLTVEQLNIAKLLPKKKGSYIFGQETDEPELFGIMELNGKKIIGVEEKPKKPKSNTRIVGAYILEKEFFKYLKNDFEEALDEYVKNIDTEVINVSGDTLALKYPWHLFSFGKYLMDTKLKKYIDKTAKISKTAKINGKVYIGKNVKIFDNTVINGPCYIGDNSVVGNNSLIRDYVNIENNSLIGYGCEITRSIIMGDNEFHAGFFGDCIIGKGSKFGHGTVSGNVRIDRREIKTVVKGKKINTRLKSFGFVAGENVVTGIKTMFMPGRMIGGGSFVGPGTVVMENIKENTKVYSKFLYIEKKNVK